MGETEGCLALADWRRQIAELYAQVRRQGRTDPAGAAAHWRAARERLYREHPQSPVPPAERGTFRARHFPYDAALRFEVNVLPSLGADEDVAPGDGASRPGSGTPLTLPTSAGGGMAFHRIGSVDVPFPQGGQRLALYWMEGYAGGLFLPFCDATNGQETYGGGRYLLDGAKGADLGGDPARNTLILDFNFAFQPSCAFDPQWVCPLASPESRLPIPVRAGERLT